MLPATAISMSSFSRLLPIKICQCIVSGKYDFNSLKTDASGKLENTYLYFFAFFRKKAKK
jgi:hypothetical protein